jgi:cob(I)alamin adenosyltransferase
MSISTRQGDEGRTRLFSGETISKSDRRPSTYGDLDEAISAMGLARSLAVEPRVVEELLRIQKICFVAGSELATSAPILNDLPERLDPSHLEHLESLIEEMESGLELPSVFIVPGNTPSSAAIDLARAIVRRLERSVVQMLEEDAESIRNETVLPWLNRLSDVLFLLARLEERGQGVDYEQLKEKPGSRTGI